MTNRQVIELLAHLRTIATYYASQMNQHDEMAAFMESVKVHNAKLLRQGEESTLAGAKHREDCNETHQKYFNAVESLGQVVVELNQRVQKLEIPKESWE